MFSRRAFSACFPFCSCAPHGLRRSILHLTMNPHMWHKNRTRSAVNPHCTILLVDDDEDDAFLVRRALEKLGFDGMFRRVSDIENARAYLEGSAPYSDREYN